MIPGFGSAPLAFPKLLCLSPPLGVLRARGGWAPRALSHRQREVCPGLAAAKGLESKAIPPPQGQNPEGRLPSHHPHQVPWPATLTDMALPLPRPNPTTLWVPSPGRQLPNPQRKLMLPGTRPPGFQCLNLIMRQPSVPNGLGLHLLGAPA